MAKLLGLVAVASLAPKLFAKFAVAQAPSTSSGQGIPASAMPALNGSARSTGSGQAAIALRPESRAVARRSGTA